MSDFPKEKTPSAGGAWGSVADFTRVDFERRRKDIRESLLDECFAFDEPIS